MIKKERESVYVMHMQITPVSFSFMPSRYDTIGGIVLSYGKLSMPGLWNLLELLRMLSRLLLVIKRTDSRVVNVWLSMLMMFSPVFRPMSLKRCQHPQ